MADGGSGLPLLGWSTVGGDPRIPHLVGMHALQSLPLFAILLGALASRFPRLRPVRCRRALVRIAGVGYAGLVALVTWQVLRGQSIVRADWQTVLAAALLVALLSAAAAAVFRANRPAAPSPWARCPYRERPEGTALGAQSLRLASTAVAALERSATSGSTSVSSRPGASSSWSTARPNGSATRE